MASESAHDALNSFVAWFTSNGGRTHPGVDIDYDFQRGISLRRNRTNNELHKCQAVVTCPHSLSLSSLNALGVTSHDGLPKQLPPDLLADSNPRLTGAIFLCVQWLLGERSFWYPYLNILPQPHSRATQSKFGLVESPMYWTEQQLAWLDGTNMARGVEEVLHSWQTMWHLHERTLKAWIADMNLEPLDWELFKWALTIFGSRSFSAAAIRDVKDARTTSPILEVHNPHSLLYPGIDLLNHWPWTKNRWSGSADAFEIILNDDSSPGKEVWNTYGSQSNAQLLLSWGFCLPANPYDSYALKLLSNTHAELLNIIDNAQPNAGRHDVAGPANVQPRDPSALGTALPAAEQGRFTSCDLANNLFMIRDPISIFNDEDYPLSASRQHSHLRGFPEPLLARLAAQVANRREQSLVQTKASGFNSTQLYQQLGSRNLFELEGLLQEKLDITAQAMRSVDLEAPSCSDSTSQVRFQQAKVYRDGQLHILQTNSQILAQHAKEAQAAREHTRTPILVTIKALLKHFQEQQPNRCNDLLSGFAEMSSDIEYCVSAMYDQQAEDIFMVIIIAALKLFASGMFDALGQMPRTFEWYASTVNDEDEDVNDTIADVRQYVSSMQEACPDSTVWHDGGWKNTALLSACVRFVRDETVNLAPHASGVIAFCV